MGAVLAWAMRYWQVAAAVAAIGAATWLYGAGLEAGRDSEQRKALQAEADAHRTAATIDTDLDRCAAQGGSWDVSTGTCR